MMREKPGETLADRLKETASKAKISSYKLATLLGVTSGAVRAWWTGRNEPSIPTLAAYAHVVGSSVDYLATGKDTARERAVDLLVRTADLVMAGSSASDAFGEVLGTLPPLTEAERARLDASTEHMRAGLSRHAAREWDTLSLEAKREIWERIFQTSHNRPEGPDTTREGGAH